jgi:hypothetical protein
MGKTSKGKAISKEKNAAIEPVDARGEKLRGRIAHRSKPRGG